MTYDPIDANDDGVVDADVDNQSVSTEVLSHDGVENVMAHGAVGDGSTDDSAALQSAADAASPRGVVYIPSGTTLRLSSPVDIDLGEDGSDIANETAGLTPFALICKGTIQPDGGLSPAIHIHNGAGFYVDFKTDGGGQSTSDTALLINDVQGGYVEGTGVGYDGTVLRITDGEFATTNLSIGRLETVRVGKTLEMEAGANSQRLDGWGQIGDIWENRPSEAITFTDVNDISINQYENYIPSSATNKGVVFDNCKSIWIDKLLSGGGTNRQVIFRDCKNVKFGKLYALSGDGDGVVFDGTEFVWGWVYVKDNPGASVKIDQSANSSEVSGDIYLEGLIDDSGIDKGDEDPVGYQSTDAVIGYNLYLQNLRVKATDVGVDIDATGGSYFIENTGFDSNATVDIDLPSPNNVHLKNIDLSSGISGSPASWNGTVFSTGPPSAGDYGVEDAGTEIIDTSAPTPEPYLVQEDGSVDKDLVASYVEGDILSQSYPVSLEQDITVSASDWQSNPGLRVMASDDALPSNGTVVAFASFKTGGTMDADGDYRLETSFGDVSDVTTVSQANTFAYFRTDPVEVTGSGEFDMLLSLRSDGTNTISLFGVTIYLGVVL